MPNKNKNYDWLTFESLFNKKRFRRTNKKLEMGLYVIKRSDVTVFFRNYLDPDLVEKLSDAFFPDVDPEDHLKKSNAIWDWKNKDSGIVSIPVTPLDKPLKVNRKETILHLDTFVVLPYNIYDNDGGSFALGTKESAKLKQLKPEYKWSFWKTASRSCVVRTSRIKPKDDPLWNSYFQNPWVEWEFSEGKKEREALEVFHATLDYPDEDSLYSLTDYTSADFSVKTGVIFVGSENQKAAKKDFLDDNWIIACLRSDYVAEIDNEMKDKRSLESLELSNNIVVLTELLSINETEKRIEGKYKDGVQIRDLSALEAKNLFVPPLTIPFLDMDFNLLNEEFTCLKNKNVEWLEFWRKNWAARLGRAKALFLLRYGLQHINPNPQNYLIEFKKGTSKPEPTGRIIIRDLQDAALHREVVWALYGPEGELPPQGEDKKDELKKLKLPVLKYEFEKVESDSQQETGSTNISFGPPGTQFLWQRFSAFSSGNKVTKEMETFKDYWKDLLAVMAEWGKSHNREYVRCVESQLGINFMDISWDTMADPNGYKTVNNVPEAEKKCLQFKYPPPPTDAKSDTFLVKSAVVGAFPGTKTAWEKIFPINILFDDSLKTLPCVLINGNNFLDGATVMVGKEVPERVIWKSAEQIYVKLTNETRLAVSKFSLPITVTNPSPDGRKMTLTPVSDGDIGWEENAAKVVHKYLRNAEGQKAIRDYKTRGWKPIEPKFRLQVLNKLNNPIEAAQIKISFNSKTWTDITDFNGEICIYQGNPADYKIRILGYDDSISNPIRSVLELSQRESKKLDFNFVKVLFKG